MENVIVREFLNLFIHTRLSILNFQFYLLVECLARLFRFAAADRIGVSQDTQSSLQFLLGLHPSAPFHLILGKLLRVLVSDSPYRPEALQRLSDELVRCLCAMYFRLDFVLHPTQDLDLVFVD